MITLRCDVCGAVVHLVEQWSLFFRRILRRVDGREQYTIDAFVCCPRRACKPYARFWGIA